jgi:glycosyltransferase
MKLSIITIVHNNVDCIENCVQSIKNQSFNNIEHIIIDGGSTDGTQQIIEKYRDKIAACISEKDHGLYDALNKGVRLATGDVVGVLHSDDLFFEKDTLAKIVKTFSETNADIVYANGQYVQAKDATKIKRIYRARPFKKSYLKFGWIPLHTTMYVRREVFEKHGFYDETFSIAGDYEISLRWFLDDEIKKVFLNEWVVKMQLGGKSTAVRFQKRKSQEDFQIIRKHKLWGIFTLYCKIARKIPQYALPVFFRY